MNIVLFNYLQNHNLCIPTSSNHLSKFQGFLYVLPEQGNSNMQIFLKEERIHTCNMYFLHCKISVNNLARLIFCQGVNVGGISQ